MLQPMIKTMQVFNDDTNGFTDNMHQEKKKEVWFGSLAY